jgi:hypothetical protein
VVISAFMASNQDTIDDENGESSDGVELINNTAVAVYRIELGDDLNGWSAIGGLHDVT